MITVSSFITETWEDFNSPTTSTFASRMGDCRQTVSCFEETLDLDRSNLTKMKKSVKALYNTGNTHVHHDMYLAENLERLGTIARDRDKEKEISGAFIKFSHITKDLSSTMKNMMDNLNNLVLFPLDSFLKGDLKGAKGDLKKPFDKAWKDYETKFTKTEKEKKKQAQEAGMVRAEISGAEIAEEMEKERKIFQLQMCEYLIKLNEIRTKKGPDLLQSLAEYYQVQANFFKDGVRTIEHFERFVEELQKQVLTIRQRQDAEKRQLLEIRDALKNSMTSYKEAPVNSSPAGYNLHQLSGDKSHGSEKVGYLLKKSEGRMRRVWQKRRCIIKDGSMYISHHDESKEPVKLNLLTCQVKLVHDDIVKRCFDLVSSMNNRTYHFQADEPKEMDAWISVLNNAKEEVLMAAFKDNSNSPGLNQSVRELTSSIMDRIRRMPGNKNCCDCGAPDPEWLSLNLGVMICLECCGIHREMGVHISRTQSTVIDELGTSQLLLARVIGNDSFNEIMEATLDPMDTGNSVKPKPSSHMNERRDFIKAKYEHHKFAIMTCSDKVELKQDLKQAAQSKDLQALLQVYAEGLDLSTPLPDMSNGETALHLAILENDGTSLPLIDFLIQNSTVGTLDKKTSSGDTALHLCAEFNRTECMRLLLRTRPDLARVENSEGHTPLDLARMRNFQTCIELLSGALAGKKDLFFHINIDWDLNADERYYDMDSDDDLDSMPDKPKNRSRPSSLIVIPDQLTLMNKERERAEAKGRASGSIPSNSGGVGGGSGGGGLSNNGRVSPVSHNLLHSSSSSSSSSAAATTNNNNNNNTTNTTNNTNTNINGGGGGSSSNISSSADNNNKSLGSVIGGLGMATSAKTASTTAAAGTMLPPLPPRSKKPPPPPPPVTLPQTAQQYGHHRNKSDSEMSHLAHKRTISEPPPRPQQPPDVRNSVGKLNPGLKLTASSSLDKGDVPIHAKRLSQVVAPDQQLVPSSPQQQQHLQQHHLHHQQQQQHHHPQHQQQQQPKQSADPKTTPETSSSQYPVGGIPQGHGKAKPKQRFRAAFNCDADNDDELTFKEGEIIVLIYEEEEEWWEGEIEGQSHRRGLFPLSFVTPVND